MPAIAGTAPAPWWLDPAAVIGHTLGATKKPGEAYVRMVDRYVAPPEQRVLLLGALLSAGRTGIRDAIDAGFTVREIAGALGMHRNTVYRLLRATIDPDR